MTREYAVEFAGLACREKLMNMVDELAELVQQVGPVLLGCLFAEFADSFEDGFF